MTANDTAREVTPEFAPFEASELTDDTVVLGGPKRLGMEPNPDMFTETVTELPDDPA